LHKKVRNDNIENMSFFSYYFGSREKQLLYITPNFVMKTMFEIKTSVDCPGFVAVDRKLYLENIIFFWLVANLSLVYSQEDKCKLKNNSITISLRT